MTDAKKPGPIDGIDWDQALAEWEGEPLAPKVAPEIPDDGLVERPASRRLYRPPSVPPSPGAPAGRLPASVPDAPGGNRRREPPAPAPSRDQSHAPAENREPLPDRSGSSQDAPIEVFFDPFAGDRRPEPRLDADEPSGARPAAESMAVRSDATWGNVDMASPPSRKWDDEKAASSWLDEPTRSSMVERVSWLEQEARLCPDKTLRARGLLVCSELQAMVGERDQAHSLAAEARDLSTDMPLPHRQARALAPWPPDPDDQLEWLDAEARASPPGPPRLHAILLAVDALRRAGDDLEAGVRIEEAFRIAPTDSRVAIALATRALSAKDTAASAPLLADAPEVIAVSKAAVACLQLHGHPIDGPVDPTLAPNLLLLRARQALDHGNPEGALASMAALSRIPELAAAARWLGAALAATVSSARSQAIQWLSELLASGESDAVRPLLFRAIEQRNWHLVQALLAQEGGRLSSPDHVVLQALSSDTSLLSDAHVETMSTLPDMQALVSAVDSTPRWDSHQAQRGAGSPRSRLEISLGKAVATSVRLELVDGIIHELGVDRPAAAWGIALENAVRASRFDEVSRIVETWGTTRDSPEERAIGAQTAAMIALRGGSAARAAEAYKAARKMDPASEGVLRALSALEPADIALELEGLADALSEGIPAALARIEAVQRGGESRTAGARIEMLRRAEASAPGLPLAAFMADRIARQAGDLEQTIAWTQRRRQAASDKAEAAVAAMQEALLYGERDPALAAESLLEAHIAQPMEVCLRELYERVAPDAATGRAVWMEQRLERTVGDARVGLALEAAREFERIGDVEGALRCASEAGESLLLARIALERSEMQAGQHARMADHLLGELKSAGDDPAAQLEAYERLAVLDATVRHDAASGLLWHQAILELQADHLPSLRYIEQYLFGEGRVDELETVAASLARALQSASPCESTAHAELAARLRLRSGGPAEKLVGEMVGIAFAQNSPSLWALRATTAYAQQNGDDVTLLSALRNLAERAARPNDAASLFSRAAEAAIRYGNMDEGRSLYEQAAKRDDTDAWTWSQLAELRMRAGDASGAAEAFEGLARSSGLPARQRSAWYQAGRLWTDLVGDELRAISALEAVGAPDPDYPDVFDRLEAIYVRRQMHGKLANLLERQIAQSSDPEHRLALEVRRGHALVALGDPVGARQAFETVLAAQPDHAEALSNLGDLCMEVKDWETAEQALVRLARRLPSPEEQGRVYARLSQLYSTHLYNPSRAEVALKEVLKRAPNDIQAAERLIDLYKQQNDATHAIEIQQHLVAHTTQPEDRRQRLLDLAAMQERLAQDLRRAERTLDSARREFPHDLGLLRALVEFYQRHQQAPAVKILLDRAAGDARRALAAGNVSQGVFETIATAFDLRGKRDGARVTRGIFAALEGRATDIGGAGYRALDSEVDAWLAPDLLSSAFRDLLAKYGDCFDAVAPANLRDLRATKAHSALAQFAVRFAGGIGLPGLQVFISSKIDSCLPVSSNPPTIVLGEALARDDELGPFVVVRNLKLLKSRAGALARVPAEELSVLVAAWLKCFNPSWKPEWITPNVLDAAFGKIRSALPRSLNTRMSMLALEAAAVIESGPPPLGHAALDWSARAALLALGDPDKALRAVSGIAVERPSSDPNVRLAAVRANAEAIALISFAVSDAFMQARAHLGLDA